MPATGHLAQDAVAWTFGVSRQTVWRAEQTG